MAVPPQDDGGTEGAARVHTLTAEPGTDQVLPSTVVFPTVTNT